MNALRLLALDTEDLAVISAQVQDAVTKPELLEYVPSKKQFTLVLNRFAWDADGAKRKRGKTFERRRAALSVAGVGAVRTTGINRGDSEQVLSLLAVRFDETDAPAGTLEFVFSGGPAIVMDVECIEMQLQDLGSAWETKFMPRHLLR